MARLASGRIGSSSPPAGRLCSPTNEREFEKKSRGVSEELNCALHPYPLKSESLQENSQGAGCGMNKQVTLTALLVILAFTSIGRTADCSVGIRKLVVPDYPNVARLAQISGDVHLVATVGGDGRVNEVEVVSGAPILAKYARTNLLSWAYACQPEGGRLQVVYRYRLQGKKIYGTVVPEVSLESPNEILIISNPPLPAANQR